MIFLISPDAATLSILCTIKISPVMYTIQSKFPRREIGTANVTATPADVFEMIANAVPTVPARPSSIVCAPPAVICAK